MAGSCGRRPDSEMGEGFRIIRARAERMDVACAPCTTMAGSLLQIGLIWRIKLAHAVAAGTAVQARLVYTSASAR